MGIVGVGIDLVSITEFAEQVDQPGTVFAETFTPGERRDASDKSSSAARHLAARWAAKEAVIKAWSGSRFSQRPVLARGHPSRHRGDHRHVGTAEGAADRCHRQASGRRDDPRVVDARRRYRGRGGHPGNRVALASRRKARFPPRYGLCVYSRELIHPMSDLVERVREVLPSVRRDLEELVRIESVWADPARRDQVQRSAQATADLLSQAGFDDVRDRQRGRCARRHRPPSGAAGSADRAAVRPPRCAARR